MDLKNALHKGSVLDQQNDVFLYLDEMSFDATVSGQVYLPIASFME